MRHAHLHSEALSVTSLFPSKDVLLIFPVVLRTEWTDGRRWPCEWKPVFVEITTEIRVISSLRGKSRMDISRLVLVSALHAIGWKVVRKLSFSQSSVKHSANFKNESKHNYFWNITKTSLLLVLAAMRRKQRKAVGLQPSVLQQITIENNLQCFLFHLDHPGCKLKP